MITPNSTLRLISRKRTFDVRTREAAISVVEELFTQRHTGSIVIHVSSGGVRFVTAEDQAMLPDSGTSNSVDT